MEQVDADTFVEIRMVDHMFRDHLPGSYDKALTQLRQTLMLTHPKVVDQEDLIRSGSLKRTLTRGSSTSEALLDKELPPLPEVVS